MDHALAVGRGDTLNQLGNEFENLILRQGALGQSLIQGDARDVLRHQEVRFLIAVKVVDSSDVGMVEPGKV